MQKGWHDRDEACKRLALELYQLKEQMKELEERNETLRRYNESSVKLDEQLKAQRKHKDPTGLGFTGKDTKETGESSGAKTSKKDTKKPLAQKGKKTFNTSCNHCGKPGHRTNDSQECTSKAKQ